MIVLFICVLQTMYVEQKLTKLSFECGSLTSILRFIPNIVINETLLFFVNCH